MPRAKKATTTAPAGHVPMTKSGLCQWPSADGKSHTICHLTACTCDCHKEVAK